MLSILSSDNSRLPRSRRGSLYYFWGLALIIAGIYTAVSWLTPYYLDDWTFMGNWRDDARGDHSFSTDAWWRYYTFIRGYDNGRISNALSPLSTMFSPWKEIFPFLTGIALAWAMVVVQFFVSPSSPSSRLPHSPLWLSLTWLLMILFIPWRDTIFVRDYSLNYIWSAAITLSLLLLLARKRWLPAALLAVLAGGWHESFAVATICGLALLLVVRGFKVSPRFYIVLCIYAASTMVFMLSPGMTGRMAYYVGDIQYFPSWRNYIILPVLLLSCAVLLCSPRGRRCIGEVALSDAGLVAIGIILSGYFIAVCAANTPRSFFWPDMAAIALELMLARSFCFRMVGGVREKALRRGLAFTVAALCIAQSVSVIVWQARYKQQDDRIMALLNESRSGTVFYDLSLPLHPPKYTMGMPAGHLWRNPWHYRALISFYNTPVIGVVPTSLRQATPSEETPRYINAEGSRFNPPAVVDGHLLIPFVTERGDTLVFDADR